MLVNTKFPERLPADPEESGNSEQPLKATLPGKVGGDVVTVTVWRAANSRSDAPVASGPGKPSDVIKVVRPASRFCEDGSNSSCRTTFF